MIWILFLAVALMLFAAWLDSQRPDATIAKCRTCRGFYEPARSNASDPRRYCCVDCEDSGWTNQLRISEGVA